MCNPVAIVMGVSALVSGGQAYAANRDAKKMARSQQREQESLARTQESLARTQASKRNEGADSIFDVDTENAGSDIGLGNTFLTGSQGVSNDSLNLGGGINNKLGG